jgi:hypothetical protein
MITDDTPLEEVAGHLPAGAARQLMPLPPRLQRLMMLYVRQALAEWERQEIDLNPIQYDVVVSTLVAQLADQALGWLEAAADRQRDH